MLLQLGALMCVVCTAIGQVMFKAGAVSLNESESLFAFKPLLILTSALGLYFVTSIGWVLILKRAPLGQMYPFLALSFVLVPIASMVVFGEEFSGKYFIGVFLIMAGVALCVKA